MNYVNVTVYIIESALASPKMANLAKLPPEKVGSTYSTEDEIKFNKVADGYTILYESDIFRDMTPYILAKSIISICMKNLPNTNIVFSIETVLMMRDMMAAYKAIVLSNEFRGLLDENNKNGSGIIQYGVTTSLKTLATNYASVTYANPKDIADANKKIQEKEEERKRRMSYYANDEDDNDFDLGFEYNDDDEDDDDDNDNDDIEVDDEDEDDDIDDDDPLSYINQFINDIPKEKRKANSKKKQPKKSIVKPSVVLEESKHPKKDFNRHGVVICNDKRAIKYDKKTIKKFLEEFIPGNSGWKKEYREELLDRWIKMFVVTKKQKHKLEKQHRKNRMYRNRISNNETRKALEFTQRLFNTPIDRWSDPSR